MRPTNRLALALPVAAVVGYVGHGLLNEDAPTTQPPPPTLLACPRSSLLDDLFVWLPMGVLRWLRDAQLVEMGLSDARMRTTGSLSVVASARGSVPASGASVISIRTTGSATIAGRHIGRTRRANSFAGRAPWSVRGRAVAAATREETKKGCDKCVTSRARLF